MMTYQEFYGNYAGKKLKGEFKCMFICCYITAAVMALLFLAGGGALEYLITALLFLVMGIFIQKTKKWGLCLALGIYNIIGMILTWAEGRSPGALVIVMGIFGVYTAIGLRKVSIAYKKYTMTGTLPYELIELPTFKKK